jgi:molybdate transport system substrate-binding protein
MKPLRLLAAAAALCTAAAGAMAGQVTVTTGAGYVKMVDALVSLYEKDTGAHVDKAFGGNIGQMLSQVKESGRVNVVISDAATLKRFEGQLAGESKKLGNTPLVLVWRKGIKLDAPADIATDKVKSLASPDPKAAVYGRSSQAWLKATGLDAKVKGKLNIVSTVPQVFSYVATGNMDAGFVNMAVLGKGADKIGGHFEITDESARVTMVVRPVKGYENDADVQKFVNFLSGSSAKPVLAKFGVR